MFDLLPVEQNYAWGRDSQDSTVFDVLKANYPEGHNFDTQAQYAELWMGSHPKGEASVKNPENGEFEKIGKFLKEKYNKDLPFLYKILSIKNCLSIQAHPTKELGKQLHESAPENYPDPNYKPEMAIAISEFEAFSNFCPKEELLQNMRRYEPLSIALKEELDNLETAESKEAESEALKTLLARVQNLDESVIVETVKDAVSKEEKTRRDKLVEELNEQFPTDVGIVVTLMLNYLHLQPGQSFLMNPLEPHAYFKGECFESKLP